MALKIGIRTIPHSSQEYDTVGNWFEDEDKMTHILVSDMSDWRYELLVAVHELVEQALCKARGISEESVTKFDKEFEASRQEGDESEPGDNWAAPYQKEHVFATNIERLLAAELGVDWQPYDDTVLSLE